MHINKEQETSFSPSNRQENHLWIDFINGDDKSFELIYKKCVGVLFRYGIQFTQDEDIVKDAIHDVFVRIYKNRTQLKKEVNIKFYLFTALKNSLYNTFKREMVFEKLEEQELYNILDHSDENKALSSLEQESTRKVILQLMNQLTDRQREVIYHRFIEELSMEEIGVLMQMNTQSVQNLIQRSLRKMRESRLPLPLSISLLYKIIETA